LRERGFGFDDAAAIFMGPVRTQRDDRRDYDEARIKAIGEARGRIFVVIFTDCGDLRWIISATLANSKERAAWRA